jgi:hypothetical protein
MNTPVTQQLIEKGAHVTTALSPVANTNLNARGSNHS